MDLHRRIAEGQGEFLLFALTPPRRATSPEKSQEIADATLKRLQALDLDGLVLYDIDDESDRNPQERPFPFLPTMDPAEYLSRHLDDWNVAVVVYRAVGKYAEAQLRTWLGGQEPDRVLSVFVGTSSRDKPATTSLTRAQALRSEALATALELIAYCRRLGVPSQVAHEPLTRLSVEWRSAGNLNRSRGRVPGCPRTADPGQRRAAVSGQPRPEPRPGPGLPRNR